MFKRIKYSNLIMFMLLILFTIIIIDDARDAANYQTVYQTIRVDSGDSLWTIASKYVSEKDDIRNYILVVKQINQLNDNVQLYPGQTLKIPVQIAYQKN